MTKVNANIPEGGEEKKDQAGCVTMLVAIASLAVIGYSIYVLCSL